MSASQDKGLQFRGSLPLSVTALPALPEEGDLLAGNHGNEQVLRSVMMLDEKPDPDDNDPLYDELRRQDQKINLILDMLSMILVRFNAIPAPRELMLTDSALSLAEAAASVTGPCEIQLYIEPTIPKPLRLFGLAEYDSTTQTTAIRFQGMSQALTDLLDKYIFRFHRRLVAHQKAAEQSQPTA